jgi:hypothetical protein
LLGKHGHLTFRITIVKLEPGCVLLGLLGWSSEHSLPQAMKSEVKQGTKGSKKRLVQPFAVSPMKKMNADRTSLDVCIPLAKKKMKSIPCQSSVEETRGSYIESKTRIRKVSQTNEITELYASRKRRIFIKRYGERIENEDGESTRGCESSGAKVRGLLSNR